MSGAILSFPGIGFVSSSSSPLALPRFQSRTARPGLLAESIVSATVNALLRVGASAFMPSAAYAVPVVTAAKEIIAAEARRMEVRSCGEMATQLVDQLGLPMTALATALDVERKTIYDWLKGREATGANTKRLQTLVEALGGEEHESLRFFHRLWMRELSDDTTLKGRLTEPVLDVARVRAALGELRSAVASAMASAKARKPVSFDDKRAPDSLSDFLQAGARN